MLLHLNRVFRCSKEGEEGAEGLSAFGCEEECHPCAALEEGCRERQSRLAAVPPDSCRGWSRNHLARIRAQREPVISPAGAGRISIDRQGSPESREAAQAQESPGQSTQLTGREGIVEGRFDGEGFVAWRRFGSLGFNIGARGRS